MIKKGIHRGNEVAIKEIELEEKDEATLNSVGKEAHLACLASSSDHPNVVKFFGAFRDFETHVVCLVFQYLGGGSLDRVLMKENKHVGPNRSDVSTILQMARDAACGVAELHRLGVVHRDLSTRNFLTDHQQRVRYDE